MTLYTPTWTCTRPPNPRIGNGDLLGWTEPGQWCAIQVRMGSTTTFGSSPWLFTVPDLPDDVTQGAAHLAPRRKPPRSVPPRSGDWWSASGVVADGAIRLYAGEHRSPVGPLYPFTWEAGDELRILAGEVPADWRWLDLTAAPAWVDSGSGPGYTPPRT
jgi:hypothetical protein